VIKSIKRRSGPTLLKLPDSPRNNSVGTEDHNFKGWFQLMCYGYQLTVCFPGESSSATAVECIRGGTVLPSRDGLQAHHINNGPIPLDFGNPIAETETEGAVSDHGCEEKISKDGMAPECRS